MLSCTRAVEPRETRQTASADRPPGPIGGTHGKKRQALSFCLGMLRGRVFFSQATRGILCDNSILGQSDSCRWDTSPGSDLYQTSFETTIN